MSIESLDITLARIREVESRISIIRQKIDRLNPDNDTQVKAFDKVLHEKLEETKPGLPENIDRKDIKQLINKYSKENGLDAGLVNAVIQAESAFDKNAVSPAGAGGLMQLMPKTAASLGIENRFDPEQNISGGTKYLKKLISQYGSVELGLAAYNAGPENVNKYGGIPPFSETQDYVKKVLKLRENL